MNNEQKQEYNEFFKEQLTLRKEIFQENGKQLGYPSCCITTFCTQLPSERTPNQNVIANVGHGFIPCPQHANAIMMGYMVIEELIKGRNPQFKPFPNE